MKDAIKSLRKFLILGLYAGIMLYLKCSFLSPLNFELMHDFSPRSQAGPRNDSN